MKLYYNSSANGFTTTGLNLDIYFQIFGSKWDQLLPTKLLHNFLNIPSAQRQRDWVGNCDNFFIFEFEYGMWVQIFQKFEKDQIPIRHLSE